MLSIIRRLIKNSIKEYRRNGIQSVLKRAFFLFSSPRHKLLYNHIKEWQKIKEKHVGAEETPDFNAVKGLTSVVFLIRDTLNLDLFKQNINKIKSNDFVRKYEIIIIFSKTSLGIKSKVIDFAKKKKIKKVFDLYEVDYDLDRLIKKGIKESEGEKVYILKNVNNTISRSLIKEVFLKYKNNHKDGDFEIYKNDKQMRVDLPLKIAYVVPSVGISGGLAVILRHVNILKEKGFDVMLISFNKPPKKEAWFQSIVPVVQLKDENHHLLKEIDVLVATHWSTAFFMDLYPARRKIYFVQSDERRFDRDDLEAMRLVHLSYTIKSEYMTEAIWIQRWLNDEFGHQSYYVPNGLDLDIFHKTEPIEEKKKKPRVLIEGAIDVWFKGMEDAYNAVKDLDCELWIISCQGKPKPSWRYDRYFEKVPFRDMKKIYSSCDVFLKMSRVEGFFGPPMEAMACGCAVVVGKVTGYDEYIKDKYNALVVEQGDIKAASQAVERLLSDKELREGLIANGQKTAQDWSWKRTENFLLKAMQKNPIEIHYSPDFPEKYDFTKTVANIRSDISYKANTIGTK